jgi:EAL domain-containing protein (putative c-di-GMP-specific phosphodiesterase class I)
MHHDDTTRYRLELDVLERDAALSNRRAIDLLRSEFALALNASYLMGLSAGDIEVGFVSRSIPQEGVARYAVVLELVERTPAMTDEQAGELLRREFQHAQNAAHFWRVCCDDLRVTLVARERAGAQAALRAA